ncbi:MAG: carboxyl transferase domain-containing protein [Planctomycetota bacterium]
MAYSRSRGPGAAARRQPVLGAVADPGPGGITGVGRINGLYCGFPRTSRGSCSTPDSSRQRPGGTLYQDGIAKLAQFARACDADGIPLVNSRTRSVV